MTFPKVIRAGFVFRFSVIALIGSSDLSTILPESIFQPADPSLLHDFEGWMQYPMIPHKHWKRILSLRLRIGSRKTEGKVEK